MWWFVNYGILLIWPLLRFQGRKFVGFFGKFKRSKEHSEINWPLIRVAAVVEIVVWDLGEMDFEVVIGTNSPITIVGCISVKVFKSSVCVFVLFYVKNYD